MKLNTGSIKNLQAHIAAKIQQRGFEDENLHERLLLLTEEVGELVKACRKVSGMYENQKKKNLYNPAEEIVDVINLVFAVAIKLGIDTEKEFVKKNKAIDKRFYKRTKL